MRLLAITGRAGAGKDYTYERIRDHFSDQYEVKNFKFAEALKKDIEDTLSKGAWVEMGQQKKFIPADRFVFPVLREKPYLPEIRKLLQWWGTELRRGQDPDYWVNHMKAMLSGAIESLRLIPVITDLRFLNEEAIVREMGGLILYVLAPTSVRAKRLGVSVGEMEALSRHSSEAQIPNIRADCYINNDGTPGDDGLLGWLDGYYR